MYTDKDRLRERYKKIVEVCDQTYLSKLQKNAILNAFLDTAYEYALASAEAQAWRECFRKVGDTLHVDGVSVSKHELRERAKNFWPEEWEVR